MLGVNSAQRRRQPCVDGDAKPIERTVFHLLLREVLGDLSLKLICQCATDIQAVITCRLGIELHQPPESAVDRQMGELLRARLFVQVESLMIANLGTNPNRWEIRHAGDFTFIMIRILGNPIWGRKCAHGFCGAGWCVREASSAETTFRARCLIASRVFGPVSTMS